MILRSVELRESNLKLQPQGSRLEAGRGNMRGVMFHGCLRSCRASFSRGGTHLLSKEARFLQFDCAIKRCEDRGGIHLLTLIIFDDRLYKSLTIGSLLLLLVNNILDGIILLRIPSTEPRVGNSIIELFVA